MPDDPDDEIVLGDKTTNQIGVLPALLGAASIGAAILAAAWMLKSDDAPRPEAPPAAVDTDTNTQLGIRKLDRQYSPPLEGPK